MPDANANDEIKAMDKDDVKSIMESISGEENKIFDDEPPKSDDNKETSPDDKTDDGAAEESPKSEDKKEDEAPKSEESGEEVVTDSDLIDELTGAVKDEKTPEVDPDQAAKDEALLKDASKETREAFIEMRGKIKDLSAQIESGDDSETVKALRAEINTLQGKLGSIDLAQDPDFKRKHTLPIQKEIGMIGAAIKDIGGDPKAIIDKAMTFKSKIERKQYLQREIPSFATELSLMFTRVDSMMETRREAMKDHVGEKQRLAQSSARQRAESVGKLFDAGLEEIRGTNHFLFTETKKSEKWDAAVQGRIASAKTMITEMMGDESKMVATALQAAASKDLLNLYLEQRKTLRAVQKELGIRKGAAPNLGGDGDGKAPKGEKKNEMSADEAVDAIFSKVS